MKHKFYSCNQCGNIIAMIRDKGVPVLCCGERMHEITPDTTEGSEEKHIPVYEVRDNVVHVTVGSQQHPMTTEHTAYTVKQMMRGEGITLSYSNAGCPYDNAVGESFFSTLKKEHIYRYEFRDEWEFKVSIQEYIEFYNGYRPHSTIGYLTPNEAEEAYFAENKVS